LQAQIEPSQSIGSQGRRAGTAAHSTLRRGACATTVRARKSTQFRLGRRTVQCFGMVLGQHCRRQQR